MDQPLIHRALLRKELRQLAPLVIALFGLCFAGLLGFISMPSSTRLSLFSPGWWLIAIPVLCAVGTGPMLIGQEKETRTLQWLSSLPLSTTRLIYTKLIAGLIAWACCWLVVAAAYWCCDYSIAAPLFDGLNEQHPFRSRWFVFWLLSSFYLLMLGYVTAWKFGNAMSGLIALIPLALVPTLLRFGWEYVRNPGLSLSSANYDSSFAAHLVWLLVALVPTIWFLGHFARQALATKEYAAATKNPYAAPSIIRPTKAKPVLGPSTALLWQFYKQNKRVYLSLFVSCVAFGLVTMLIDDGSGKGPAFGLRVWVSIWVCVTSSWMGVMVFQSDNLQERIRFLADRGVSPWKSWLIRMAWPLLFISAMIWLYALDWYIQSYRGVEVVNLSAHFVAALLLLYFFYGQWFAQLVKQPLLSALGAPVISALALTYCITVCVGMAVSFWSVIPFALIPLFATALMMQSWMDRRINWKYYARHVGLIGCGVLLPVGISIGKAVQTPGMDAAMRPYFESSNSMVRDTSFPQFVSLLPDPPSVNQIALNKDQPAGNKNAVEPYPSIEEQISKIETDLSSLGGGIQVQPGHLKVAFGELELAKLSLEQSPGDEVKLQDYRGELTRLVMVAERLRLTSRLFEQEQADAIEIVLISHMSSPESIERFGDTLWRRCVAAVSHPEQRNEMRMKAVVSSWSDYHRSDNYTQNPAGFGGYPYLFDWNNNSHTWGRLKRVDYISGLLMRMLIDGPKVDEANRVAWLRELSGESSLEHYSIVRIDNPQSQLADVFRGDDLPGSQWLAGWEQVGASFAESNTNEVQP